MNKELIKSIKKFNSKSDTVQIAISNEKPKLRSRVLNISKPYRQEVKAQLQKELDAITNLCTTDDEEVEL